MPLAVEELRRGRIVLGLFPFSTQFPVRLPGGDPVASVEDFAALRCGAPSSVVVDARLRPLLLLHDRTRGAYGDVVCLRVSSVKESMRVSPAFVRIERHEHPYFFHLAAGPRYGLRDESIIAFSSIRAVHRSSILGPRHVGELTVREMQVVSERLAGVLGLDLAPAIASRARELVLRLAQLRSESGSGDVSA